MDRAFGAVAKRRHTLVGEKSLALAATLYLNKEKKEGLSELDRLRYMYIHDWEEGIAGVCKKSLAELFEKSANGTGKVSAAELARMLEESSTTPLDPVTARDAVEILFPKHRMDGKCFAFDEVDRLFYWNIRFEVPLRSYLTVGLEMGELVSAEVRNKLEAIYAAYDKDEDRVLNYFEFLQVLEEGKKKRAKWEALALYDEAKEEDGKVHFDDFLYKLLISPALKGFFDE